MPDYAAVAYEAWAELVLAEDERVVPWEDLDDEGTTPWVAVEREFVRLLEGDVGDVDPGPETLRYALEYPLKGPRLRDGTKASTKGLPAPAAVFELRRPTAGDQLGVEECPEEERELRLVASVMTPADGGRLTWRHIEEMDAEDLLELRRLVFAGWPSLEKQLYGAWRGAVLEVEAVELAKALHPEDAEAFLALERAGEDRERVLKALDERRALERAAEGLEAERWEGEPAWRDDLPTWARVRCSGSSGRWIWHSITQALATEGLHDGIRLFTAGMPRTLMARERLKGKDMIALRRGGSHEAKVLNLAASLAGVDAGELRRLSIDDYERLVRTANDWLGKRQREQTPKHTSRSGLRTSKQRSPTSAAASGSSSPSP